MYRKTDDHKPTRFHFHMAHNNTLNVFVDCWKSALTHWKNTVDLYGHQHCGYIITQTDSVDYLDQTWIVI